MPVILPTNEEVLSYAGLPPATAEIGDAAFGVRCFLRVWLETLNPSFFSSFLVPRFASLLHEWV